MAHDMLEEAPLILNVIIRWRCVVIYTLRLLYPRRKSCITDWKGCWV